MAAKPYMSVICDDTNIIPRMHDTFDGAMARVLEYDPDASFAMVCDNVLCAGVANGAHLVLAGRTDEDAMMSMVAMETGIRQEMAEKGLDRVEAGRSLGMPEDWWMVGGKNDSNHVPVDWMRLEIKS